jgi:hypothetical protein
MDSNGVDGASFVDYVRENVTLIDNGNGTASAESIKLPFVGDGKALIYVQRIDPSIVTSDTMIERLTKRAQGYYETQKN